MYAGAYLNKPEKRISSSAGENEHLVFGVAQMQGWRTMQEDAHNCMLDFDDSFSLFAVYDGHGGPEVSTLASRRLPPLIRKSQFWSTKNFKTSLVEAFMNFDDLLLDDSVLQEMLTIRNKATLDIVPAVSSDSSCLDKTKTCTKSLAPAGNNIKCSTSQLKSSAKSCHVLPFKKRSLLFENNKTASSDDIMNENLGKNDVLPGVETSEKIGHSNVSPTGSTNGFSNGYIPAVHSGSTACTLLINPIDSEMYVANIGDSRCVLARAGHLSELSVDHKPEETEERRRIESAGGWLGVEQRVNDVLNLSRSFGDHAAKSNANLPKNQQIVIAYPDVRYEKLLPTDKFVVVACDGIWNSLTSQELIDLITQRISKGRTPVQVCEEVCEMCLSSTSNGLDDTGCDNMTIIIVKFK